MKKKIFSYLFIIMITLFYSCSVKAIIKIDYSNSNNQLKASKCLTGTTCTEEDDYAHTSYKEKVSTNNKVVYCGDVTRGIPGVDGIVEWTECTNHTSNKKELTYIFEKGYGSENSNSDYLASDKKESYLITQMAIWAITNPDYKWIKNLDRINSSDADATEKKMKQLIEDAKAAAAEDAAPEVKLTLPASKELKITSDGKYYTTGAITIGGTNIEEINPTLDETSKALGAFITKNKDGKEAETSFGLGDIIYIKIPASNVKNQVSISLNVTAKTFLGNGTITECDHKNDPTGIQSLLEYTRGLGDAKGATEAFTVKITPTNVTISKTDIAGSKEIEGAHLVVKDKNGNTVSGGEWISETNPKTLSLTPGTYTLTETIAPEGYIKSSETIEFVIGDDGKVKVDGKEVERVTMKNKPIMVYISKRSINGKDELPGAKLKITNKSNDKLVKDLDGKELEWISTTKEQSFHLAAGTYILTESLAPKGYETSDTKLEFTVTEDGKVLVDKKAQEKNLIIFRNTPEAEIVPTGSAYIYIAIILGIISLGICGYAIYNNKKKAEK